MNGRRQEGVQAPERRRAVGSDAFDRQRESERMRITVLSAVAGAALIAGVTAQSPSPSSMSASMMHKPMQVRLTQQNASGETGTATLLDGSKGLIVRLRLEGGNSEGPQPAHIHKGTCDKLDPKPTYPLENVGKGMSETVIPNVTVAQLEKTPFAINVHKSTSEVATYVSCGNVTAPK